MAAPPQHFYTLTPSSYGQAAGASPQGFRSRPGSAVPVSSPVPSVTSPSVREESNHSASASSNKDLSTASSRDSSNLPSDSEDVHRMAAPESCLHPSQVSGEQARALASVLAEDSDKPRVYERLDVLEISDQQESEGADEVIEEASDVLDVNTWNNCAKPVEDEKNHENNVPGPKCPSAPATPSGQRRFTTSEFRIVEWTLGDLADRNALSEPSLHLECASDLENYSSGDERQDDTSKDKMKKKAKTGWFKSPKNSPKRGRKGAAS